MLLIGKLIVLSLWVMCGVSLLYPAEGGAVMALRYGALLVLGIHALEVVLFRNEIRAKASNPVFGYLLVLVFGAVQMAQWRSTTK